MIIAGSSGSLAPSSCHLLIVFDFISVVLLLIILATERSQVRVPAAPRNDLGQVVHTHVPLFTKQYKLLLRQAGSLTGTAHNTLAPCLRTCSLAGVWLRAIEMEISTAL